MHLVYKKKNDLCVTNKKLTHLKNVSVPDELHHMAEDCSPCSHILYHQLSLTWCQNPEGNNDSPIDGPSLRLIAVSDSSVVLLRGLLRGLLHNSFHSHGYHFAELLVHTVLDELETSERKKSAVCCIAIDSAHFRDKSPMDVQLIWDLASVKATAYYLHNF